MKSFRVYAGVLLPEDEVEEDSSDDEEEDEGEGDEPQAAELFNILELEGADTRLPPHLRCSAHRMNNIAGKDVDEALKNPDYKTHSQSAMRKAKALFKKQKMSSQAADHIRANCGGLLFVIPNKTRWNRDEISNVSLREQMPPSSLSVPLRPSIRP